MQPATAQPRKGKRRHPPAGGCLLETDLKRGAPGGRVGREERRTHALPDRSQSVEKSSRLGLLPPKRADPHQRMPIVLRNACRIVGIGAVPTNGPFRPAVVTRVASKIPIMGTCRAN